MSDTVAGLRVLNRHYPSIRITRAIDEILQLRQDLGVTQEALRVMIKLLEEHNVQIPATTTSLTQNLRELPKPFPELSPDYAP